jgi:hypothetical protein
VNVDKLDIKFVFGKDGRTSNPTIFAEIAQWKKTHLIIPWSRVRVQALPLPLPLLLIERK